MKMERLIIQLPSALKRKLDALRAIGLRPNWHCQPATYN